MFFFAFLASCAQPMGDVLISQKAFEEIAREKNNSRLLLDVREVSEFNKFHIPGTVNIPLSFLIGNDVRVADYLKTREDLREIIIICNTHNRSRKAREILIKQGVEIKMLVLEMGVTGYAKR